jgi:hypothetical protein
MKSVKSALIRWASIGAIFLLSAGVYLVFIRPWHLQWGATDVEAASYMPGDELVDNPTFNSTRGVTIENSPSEIWPWLVQMGYGRGGFYGYDLIENLGSKRGLASAEVIMPDLQQLQVGDDLPISVVALYKIQTIEPDRFLVWADENRGAFTWGLYPLDESHTRLILRFRFRHDWYDWVFTEWADPIAVRKILLGIKDRAEGRVEPMVAQNLEIMTWGAAALELIAAVILTFRLRHWWKSWMLAFLSAATLIFSLYLPQFHTIGVFLEAILLVGLLWVIHTAQLDEKKGKKVVLTGMVNS